jgi:type I restriction enzyme S subunit
MAARESSTHASESFPPDWREVPLGSVADVRFSSVDKLTYPSEEPVRLCNYIDVYKNDYITRDLDFMQASATQPEIDRFGLEVGDVLITKDSETPDDIGIPAVVDYSAPDLVCGYHLGFIRPKKDEVDPTFLAKQLGHHRIARYFGRQANGLTRYGLPIGVVTGTPLWLPRDTKEQVSVGRLLRLIDEAIAETKAVIAKLRQVRAGLLHDLLTRGLDKHGQLRDPIAHPEQFKDSSLGRIPKEWEVVRVEDAGEVRLGRQRSPEHEYGMHMTPYLRVANVFDCYIDYSDVLAMNFDPSEQVTYGLRPGDILLNEGQSLELVGRSAIFTGPVGVFCFQNTLVRFRCNTTAMADFCQAVFKFWLDTRRFTLIAKQTTSVAHLGADRFAKMLFARPYIREQHLVAERLRAHDQLITAETEGLKKLQMLKSGLMSDLLTGRVRVAEGVYLTGRKTP